jgi:hypothetical protein
MIKQDKKVVKKVVPKSTSKEEKPGLIQTKKILTAEGYRRKFLTKSKKG